MHIAVTYKQAREQMMVCLMLLQSCCQALRDSILCCLIQEPAEHRPHFMTLYFEETDHAGHALGPEGPHIDKAIERLDEVMGMLINGLQDLGVLDDLHIILVGDHGMTAKCEKKAVLLDELLPSFNTSWIESWFPMFGARPPADRIQEVYQQLDAAIKASGAEMQVWLREDSPERWHYKGSERIRPIVGVAAEGTSDHHVPPAFSVLYCLLD